MKTIVSIALLTVILFGILPLTGVSSASGSGIKDARKHAEEKLLPLEGIAGISHTDDPPKIIVYVEQEKHRNIVPSDIDGFKTEVVVTGKIKSLAMTDLESIVMPEYAYPSTVSRTSLVRPIVGGISLGIPVSSFGGYMAGTLGVVTNDNCILTCAHVIAMNAYAQFLPKGTPVLQPGTYDRGTSSNQVGILYKYIRITFGSRGTNYADAAIANITASTNSSKALELGSDNQSTYLINGSTVVNLNDNVTKSGRTTGVTINTVISTNSAVKVYYTSYTYAIFKDQIIVQQPFIQAGDSGSLVDKNGKFVGLAFAGSNTLAIVCKASYIISGLGISI